MKKKVLTVLLAVTMTATAGSPVSATEFTSDSEFSENIVNSEDVLKNNEDVTVLPEPTEETKPAEAAEEENTGEFEESGNTEDSLEFSAKEITEDSVPEFEDGQENVFTENAEAPSTSAKYPYMKKSGDVYTATIKNATEKNYVKFVPNETGKYVVKETATSLYGYTNTNGAYLAYDSKFKILNNIPDERQSYSCYKLEKGKTYYFGCNEPCSKVIFQAEILADIISIKPVKIDKSVVFYTPIDFHYEQYGTDSYYEQYGTSNKNEYSIAERWRGKIKITYSNGTAETISTASRNKYGQWLNRYIIYKGKKSIPEAGTYDIHLQFDGSKTETIIKNIKVKTISKMPTLNESGKKTVKITSNGMYVRFKTGKNTKYQVSASFPYYRLGDQPISIKQEKNGSLKNVGIVRNGEICTLKKNKVYYFTVNLHSGWTGNPTGTIQVTPKN